MLRHIFQDPPRPSEVWINPAQVPVGFSRPRSPAEKHFGQWCRNLSVNRYICCGNDLADCCFGIQTWVYVIFGGFFLTFLLVLTFYLTLQFSSMWVTSGSPDDNTNTNNDEEEEKEEPSSSPSEAASSQQRLNSGSRSSGACSPLPPHPYPFTAVVSSRPSRSTRCRGSHGSTTDSMLSVVATTPSRITPPASAVT